MDLAADRFDVKIAHKTHRLKLYIYYIFYSLITVFTDKSCQAIN